MDIGSNLPFIKAVVRVAEVDSTSDLARRLVDSGHPVVPALVWADRQARGRGQRSNTWWSDAGSLTATLILDPRALGLSVERESRVALSVAVATIEAIRALYPNCRAGLRWPNDVEVGGRKLGGILPERVESPDGPRLLIGLGLNVRTRLEDAPPEVRRMAATLADWPESPPSPGPIAALLADTLRRLPEALAKLVLDESEASDDWNRLDTLAGTRVQVAVGPEVVDGTAAGIDPSGGLRVVAGGVARVLMAGSVLRSIDFNL